MSKHQHRPRKCRVLHPPPLFWDRLSRLWLTKSALREVHRRSTLLSPIQEPSPSPDIFAPEFLRNCSATTLRELKQFSHCGGPDTSDLRGGLAPDTEIKTKTGNTTVYDAHFESHIIDHGVFLSSSTYPDGVEPSEPANLDEIRTRLRARRPSLDLSSQSLQKEYKEFCRLNDKATSEQLVLKDILPILEGKKTACFQTGGGHLFNNLAPLTDGTLANAKPDLYYGATPNQLNADIRKQLNDQIMPSNKSNRPVAPNLFVEMKGNEGSVPAVHRQACYDGALGARSMHSLQQYGNETGLDRYDNNAYTLEFTYHTGTLGMYVTHPTRPRLQGDPGRQTDYVMTKIGKWALDGDSETYKHGSITFRNARDLAQEYRDEFIKRANERHESGRCSDQATGDSGETEETAK
ncbi:hypothetical protein P170DRAFT_448394 [Aspergillus steynii IBT 23096]|uniref:Uncharacterized protein n=1 Tax=Aspergillus steynii IBT 23096 TaxID=1392250 RepID=A0A2I2G0Z2_9EURO|nr:uncharacterized protein P170DRAFT_448394 [Aspergillus steynii IBT 23096]PLB46543.1 hypothetical protein P170DRAFT_448394 [Aspergillus steynii IBT 23096]